MAPDVNRMTGVQLELAAAVGGWIVAGGDTSECGTTLRIVSHGGRRWEIFVAIGTTQDGGVFAEVASVKEITE